MIYVDSREKQFQSATAENKKLLRNIKTYFDDNNIEYRVIGLDVGDYMLDKNPHLSVDHKLDIEELFTNLCTKDIGRFKRELRRANQKGIELVVLTETDREIIDIRDVAAYTTAYNHAGGMELVQQMLKLQRVFNVRFLFCTRKEIGMKILKILNGW